MVEVRKKPKPKLGRTLEIPPALPSKSGDGHWGWFFTFVLAGVGIAISNGPWWLCLILFVTGIIKATKAVIDILRKPVGTPSKAWAVLQAILAIVATALIGNSVVKAPIDLGQRAGQNFTTDLLAVQQKPDFVMLSCSNTNEDSCVVAESLIPLFQRAGWKVEGAAVERVSLGRFGTEIVIADYGPPLIDPQNPDQGVWTQLLPWRIPEKLALEEMCH